MNLQNWAGNCWTARFRFAVVEEKVLRWYSQIETVVEEDEYLDSNTWEKSVEELYTILERYVVDFEDHVQEGYVVQELSTEN